MPRLNHRGIVIGLATVIALLLGITVAPTALADDDQEQEFGMFDNFATEQTGASGSGESEVDGRRVKLRESSLLFLERCLLKACSASWSSLPACNEEDPLTVRSRLGEDNNNGSRNGPCFRRYNTLIHRLKKSKK